MFICLQSVWCSVPRVKGQSYQPGNLHLTWTHHKLHTYIHEHTAAIHTESNSEVYQKQGMDIE